MASQNVATPLSNRQWASAQGLTYVATNATPGTGIQYDLITAFSATGAGFCVIANNYAANTSRYLILDKFKAILSLTGTAPTGTTNMHFAGFIDSLALIPSANSVKVAPVNVNGGVTVTSPTAVYFPTGGAAMTIPTATAQSRLMHRCCVATSLGIGGDQYGIAYGVDFPPSADGGGTAVRATATAQLWTDAPAIFVPPQSVYVLDMWWLTAAANKPYFEYELTWQERVLP